MRVKITKRQFKILLDNFHSIGDRGLELTMSGKSAKRLKLGEAKIINKKNHFFSRIHVEDIANILFSSLNNFKKKEIY